MGQSHSFPLFIGPCYASVIVVVGELARGTLVGEKFRVVARLGQGGMGTVYEGEHTELGHRVAIKVILAAERNDEMLKRFQREAIVLGQLESDHVVRVLDCGMLDPDTPYLVMEFLKGMDLEAYKRTRGLLPVEEAAEIGISVCDALADAHSKGIVHRDIKPSNLFLVDRPGRRIIKVLDFGVSLLRRPGDESLTQAHAVLGTPLYAAPEQLTASKTADGRADLWSLGASLYELVTGEVPFPASSLVELATAIRKPPRLASVVNKSVSVAFANVLAGCLKWNLAERYPSAQELRRALKPFRVFGRSSSVFGAALTEADREALSQAGAFLQSGEPKTPISAENTDVQEIPAFDLPQQTPKMAIPAPTVATVRAPEMPSQSRGVRVAIATLAAIAAASIAAFLFFRGPKSAARPDEWKTLTSAAVPTTPEPSATSTAPLLPPTATPASTATATATALATSAPSSTPTSSAHATSKPPRPPPKGPPIPATSPTRPLLAPGER